MDKETQEALKQIYNRIETELNALRHIRDDLPLGSHRITVAKAIVDFGMGQEKLERYIFE